MTFEEIEQIITIFASDENGTNTQVLKEDQIVLAEARETNKEHGGGSCLRVDYGPTECHALLMFDNMKSYNEIIKTDEVLQVWCETIVRMLGCSAAEYEEELAKLKK